MNAILDRTGWGKCSLAQIRSKDIYAYIRFREKQPVAANTIRLDLALISRLFKFAEVKYGLETLANPVKSVERPSSAKTSRTRRLENDEEKRLLTAAHADLKPIIKFALETAMRREEIATLSWKHIDMEKRTAHLPRTKNGTARTVPLSTRAISILRALPRQLIGTTFELTKDQITDRMRTTIKRAGIKDLRFHDLRHEATSRLFENTDLGMMEISRITGHKSLSMLSRYTHLRAENLAVRLG